MIHEGGDEWYNMRGKRENEAYVRALESGKVKLCWKKIDRKSKKLNFSYVVSSDIAK